MPSFSEMAAALLAHQRRDATDCSRNYLCPADHRIQTFLYDYLQDAPAGEAAGADLRARSPRPGARALAAADARRFRLRTSSTRIACKQGVLHNPKSDRRTTQGIFHVAEGGLPDARRQDGGAEAASSARCCSSR